MDYVQYVMCFKSSDSILGRGVQFFGIPLGYHADARVRELCEKRRAARLARITIRRPGFKGFNINKCDRVCSDHFVHSVPAPLHDEDSEDWAPTVNPMDSSLNSACIAGSFTGQLRTTYSKPNKSTRKSSKLTASTNTSPGAEKEVLPIIDQGSCGSTSNLLSSDAELSSNDSLSSNIQEGISINIPELQSKTKPHREQCIIRTGANPRELLLDLSRFVSQAEHETLKAETGALKLEFKALQQKYQEACDKIRKYRDCMTNLEVDKLELRQELESNEEKLKAMTNRIDKMEEDINNKVLINMAEPQEQHHKAIKKYESQVESLQKKVLMVERLTFSKLDTLATDEEKLKFYTGLSSHAVFLETLKNVIPHLKGQPHPRALLPWQGFLITLIKLHLSLSLRDLAYRFGVSIMSANYAFEMWSYALLESGFIEERDISVTSMPMKRRCEGDIKRPASNLQPH